MCWFATQVGDAVCSQITLGNLVAYCFDDFHILREMLPVLLVEFWPFMRNLSEIVNNSTPATRKQTDGMCGTYRAELLVI